jgi:hypothetical protein
VRGIQLTQAAPMTIWCVFALAVVATFVAIGVALFFVPGHWNALQNTTAPPPSSVMH